MRYLRKAGRRDGRTGALLCTLDDHSSQGRQAARLLHGQTIISTCLFTLVTDTVRLFVASAHRRSPLRRSLLATVDVSVLLSSKGKGPLKEGLGMSVLTRSFGLALRIYPFAYRCNKLMIPQPPSHAESCWTRNRNFLFST